VNPLPPQTATQATGSAIPALESLGGDALLRALRTSARPGERPEELLFDLKLLRDRDFALELSFSSGRPFVGLRDFVPDERLFLYLPVSVAVAHRVCPLVLIGDSLKLASAFLDPDLSYLESRFPHLGLELVLAPRDEILHSLNLVAPA
jgi:hypothetical protein